MILCDVGNTTFNFFIKEENKRYLLEEKLPLFNEPIYFISVNEKASSKLKKSQKSCIDLEKYLKFETSYKGMGIDRKVACLGLENVVVVDAGSAITVDIIKDKKHMGGFIWPGLKKFQQSYISTSVKLDYEINTKVNLDKIPLCTQDAISYSILKSIILPIKEIAENKKIIFTGGDGEVFHGFFKNSVYKKNLIFENMKRIINAYNCIT